MLALLPSGHEPCFFLKGAFLKRLPADVRAHLIRDDFSDPISFALKADEIYKSRVSASQVYSVSSSPEEELSINAVRPTVPNRSRRSATPHTSSRQTSRSQSPTLCYYHRAWGSRAKKCRAPCSWSENQLTGRRTFVHFLPGRLLQHVWFIYKIHSALVDS